MSSSDKPSEVEIQERISQAYATALCELPDDAPWWWLSYASQEGPLGVVVVRGADILDAMVRARLMGIRPGGQVVGREVPDQFLSVITNEERNVLLKREQVIALMERMGLFDILRENGLNKLADRVLARRVNAGLAPPPTQGTDDKETNS